MKLRLIFGLLAGLTLLGGVSSADYSDNFNGGLQQPWQFGQLDGLGMPSPTASLGVVDDQLVFTDSNPADIGGAVFGFAIHPEPFDDVFMSATINPNGNLNINDSHFLFARGNPVTTNFTQQKLITTAHV